MAGTVAERIRVGAALERARFSKMRKRLAVTGNRRRWRCARQTIIALFVAQACGTLDEERVARVVAVAKAVDALGAPVADIARFATGTRRATRTDAAHPFGADALVTARRSTLFIEPACLAIGDPAAEHLPAWLGNDAEIARRQVARLLRQSILAAPGLVAIEIEVLCVPRGPEAARWSAASRCLAQLD
jgi:hypothetical protein